MSKKRYIVKLTEDERQALSELLTGKRVGADRRRRAQIFLKVDEGEHGPGWTDEAAAEAFDVSPATVRNLRKLTR